MIKKILLLIIVLVMGIALYRLFPGSSQPEFEIEEGYSWLYDGKSLAGWRVIGGESTFEASGEDIVGHHGPGENTFLRTEQSYSDFSLKMQMRWDEPGNSGVMFRAQQREGNGRTYGYQYELDHSERSWSGGIYDEARRGWLDDLADNAEAREAIRMDDWNDIEIEARGASLKTWINGVPAADVIDGLDAQGYIGLQVHGGDIGVMRWRRIRIKELPPLAQAGQNLASASEWRLDNIGELSFQGTSISGFSRSADAWMTPRRQFDDALVRMVLPACEQASIVQLRYSGGNGSGADSFAEVRIYEDRAEARLLTAEGAVDLKPVELEKAAQHAFVGVTVGSAVTLTVDNRDVLREFTAGLADRGQLRIQPADCTPQFTLSNFNWLTLKEKSSEVLFYQTLDNEPAPVLTPKEALSAFSVAPGFEVELVAAEPLVEDPVAMAWDEYGRLYVVEMRGYMPDAYGSGSEEPVGQVVRLEDTNGDGTMDTSEVFLGGLVNPRAVAVVNDGILIAEPPRLWLCKLPDKSAQCTDKREVGGYATNLKSANVEHLENGLLQGLDNWLYNSKSARRLRMTDGLLEEQQGLYRGQWGITKDNYGRLLYNHNSTWLQADLFTAEDLVEPGSSSYPPGLGVNLTELSEVFSVRVNPGVNRAYLDGTLREDGRLHKATGVSGLVAYRGDQFPKEFQSDVFVPEAAGNVVAQFALSEEGMELSAQQRLYSDETWGQRDFLGSSDERFRPVDAMNGPDGTLYIIDMYRGIVQDDHYLTDELREQVFQRGLDKPLGMGRIWRVRHKEGKTDHSLNALAEASDTQLLAALGDGNGWTRDTAQRLLQARGQALEPALVDLARNGDTLASIHAIWTLQGRGELQRELVMVLAQREDSAVQIQALRAGHGQLQATDLEQLQVALGQSSEAVAMQLAFAMGDAADNENLRLRLADMLEDYLSSAYVRQAVVRAVQGHELKFLNTLLATDTVSIKSPETEAVLSALAVGAYRSLRGDLDSADLANPELEKLLALAASRKGNFSWQQIAFLEGFKTLPVVTNFKPALLAAAPPIFADGTISERDPLWNARLGARVAFTWPGDELALGIKPLSPEQLQQMSLGEKFYANCSACHGEVGAGTPGLAPPLSGALWVTGPPEWLARIILQGMNGPIEVNGETWDGIMPPHGHLAELDDRTLGGLMTFLRRSWGNKADPVSTKQVVLMRAASAARTKPWTAAELEAVPYDRGFSRYVGKYSVSFITMTISEEVEGLQLSVPMYGGGPMTQISNTVFEAKTGDEEIKFEFVVEEDSSVNKMIMHREGQKIVLDRNAD